MRRAAGVLLALAALVVLVAAPAAGAEEELVAVSLLGAEQPLHPGQSRELTIRLQVAPGFHINGPRSGSSGLIPTRLRLEAGQGLSFGPLRWPRPREVKLSFLERPAAVYDGRVLVRTTVRVAEDAAPGPRRVRLKLSYQACDDQVCQMPRQRELVFTLRVAER